MTLTLIGVLLYACQKDYEILPLNEVNTTQIQSQGMMKLGKQLENPYSIENMSKALDNLRKSNVSFKSRTNEFEITTTHLYIKFKPKNEAELSILKKDSTLVLYDYPLDYEIEQTGDFYHDSEVTTNQPTYQYCSVELGKKLPSDIENEILAELFIPDEDSDELDDTNAKTIKFQIIDDLVTEALHITNNLKDFKSQSENFLSARRSKWRPAGTINVYDNVLRRYSPVVGIEVRARRWFTTHKGTTNTQGRYSCNGRFRRDANYSIKWERYHYSIRSGTFGQAKFDGPKRRGDWDVNIGGANTSNTVLDRQQYYALIHQAAYDYYYRNIFGLSSPPRNSLLKPQAKISASQTQRQHDKTSHAASYARTFGIFPTIYIRDWNEPSDNVYGTTIHELAHTAHWDMDRSAFRQLVKDAYKIPVLYPSINNSTEAVIESWPTGVEWVFTTHRYRTYLSNPSFNYPTYPSNLFNYQDRKIEGFTSKANDLIYTSIIIDLMDNDNQRITRGNGRPTDRVSGYTIGQIERALRGSRSWNQFRDRVKNINSSNTDNNQIDELFANWY
ncbi:hypothetical protein M4I21_05125 [Cellulophaga sp. 20_2_10]|uniref:hypothetical protein n=1 Tax=Cellulophaga sp. 20_2_10 TaxID=2942476 RepID=UPI00201AA1D5|nr:hypothetical protein [Cellulophaga sp. 20_2_10]MCL5245180.1 hypothetical protein [Cellulophaga sp. 20_2_10]